MIGKVVNKVISKFYKSVVNKGCVVPLQLRGQAATSVPLSIFLRKPLSIGAMSIVYLSVCSVASAFISLCVIVGLCSYV